MEQLVYASSCDSVQPLLADVAFSPDGKPKPLLVVMHGYGCNRFDVTRDILELSARGVVAVAPDMRGYGGSAGTWDSGGLDVHDILDVVLSAVAAYPRDIDARSLHIVGYSGGGGNAISCKVRFPDLFQTAISFFGVSDYAGFHRDGTRPDCNQLMEKTLGGTPDQVPEVYVARNAIPAAANARYGLLHFLWDEEETMCPPALIEKFLAVHRAAGLANTKVHISRKGDAKRWIHNYRTHNPDLSAADDLFLPDVLAPMTASPRLEPQGRLVVPGYLVTRHFQVWVADGRCGRVTIEYDLSGKTPDISVMDNPGNYPVRIEFTSPLATLP